MMRSAIVCAAIFATGLIGGVRPADAAPAVPESLPGFSQAVPVQGWRERCRYLRYRLHDLEQRRAYGPPWERRRVEHRIRETRRELRHARCW